MYFLFSVCAWAHPERQTFAQRSKILVRIGRNDLFCDPFFCFVLFGLANFGNEERNNKDFGRFPCEKSMLGQEPVRNARKRAKGMRRNASTRAGLNPWGFLSTHHRAHLLEKNTKHV
jgi:hypothetical protein